MLAAACAAVIWAGAPCIDAPRRPRVWSAALAGVVAGAACYGYAAMRLVIPGVFALGFAATFGSWARFARERRGLLAFAGMILALAVTVGPLLHRHLTDPAMNRRMHYTLMWSAGDPVRQKTAECLARYAAHFGPWFLFVQGSHDPVFAPPAGHGFMHWYTMPLLVIGAAVLIRRAWASLSARLLLAMLLAYPAADVTFGLGTTPHPLRSFPGVVPLCLSAAVGAVAATRWLADLGRPLYATLVGGFCVWVVVAHTRHLVSYFGRFDNDTGRYWQRHVDLMQACQWLKPRFEHVDAVFCTQNGIPFPHAMMLVFLDYDPRRWFAEPREYAPCPPILQAEQVCTRFGKVRLMYNPQESLNELLELGRNNQSDRVVLILRPGQKAGPHHPVQTIAAFGDVWLHLYDLDI